MGWDIITDQREEVKGLSMMGLARVFCECLMDVDQSLGFMVFRGLLVPLCSGAGGGDHELRYARDEFSRGGVVGHIRNWGEICILFVSGESVDG